MDGQHPKIAEATSQIVDRQVFERLHPKLIARFRAAGASMDEARDLVQETFFQIQRALTSFEGRSQFDTWAVSIAKKVWLKARRGQYAQKRQADEVSLDTEDLTTRLPLRQPNAEEQVVTKEMLSCIARAIQEFPETMQQAFILFFNGHKYREIAQQLGVSESRVASLIHQARAKLRKQCLPEGGALP